MIEQIKIAVNTLDDISKKPCISQLFGKMGSVINGSKCECGKCLAIKALSEIEDIGKDEINLDVKNISLNL